MRSIVVLSTLLTLSLVGSYLTWTAPEKAATADSVPMYAAAKADVTSVRWKTENLSVHLERKEDKAGAYTWVSVTERKEVRAPIPAAVEGEEPPPAPEPTFEETTTVFLGNTAADDLLGSFAPLYALRDLAVSDASSAAFGLDKPQGSLEITRRTGPITLDLGGETYGTKDRYIRQGDKVWLVAANTLRPLQNAKARLFEGALQPNTHETAATVRLEGAGGVQAAWTQVNRADKAKAFWAKPEDPKTADDLGTAVVDKLLRLRAQKYIPESEPPTGITPEYTFAMTGDKGEWTVQLARQTETGDWYARGGYTRGWVLVTKGLAVDLEGALAELKAGPQAAPPVEP